MKLSPFGQLMSTGAPIVQLMEDLGNALNQNPNLLFLGGGNPAHVPEAHAILQKHLLALAESSEVTRKLLGVYQSPQGNEATLSQLARYLNKQHGWPISERNIALVNGSQSAFFILLNAFACASQPAILPIVPEYLGYASQSVEGQVFKPFRPVIEHICDTRFKYAVDFTALESSAELSKAGLMAVSRPTNPSGNMVRDDELQRMLGLSQKHQFPLILDCAYGEPFPGVSYVDSHFPWQEGMITVMSLSKLGLPGVRTGIVVASEEVIQMVAHANTVLSLASGNLGPMLLERLLTSGDMNVLTKSVLPSFYREQRNCLIQLLDKYLDGLPYLIHEAEGAFFLWLWFPNLPISTSVLYERLKTKGVLIMAGEYFFFGLENSWPHARECVRLTYCQKPEVLEEAVRIIARELQAVLA